MQEFLLEPDEHITEVFGMHTIFLRYLVLYTDTGRNATFGEEDGRSFVVHPEQPEKVLTGIYGQYQSLGLTGIGFKWDYPQEELGVEQESDNMKKV